MTIKVIISSAGRLVERARHYRPDAVVSLENPNARPGGDGAAPRLSEALGLVWGDLQKILGAWDVESVTFGLRRVPVLLPPPRRVVQSALAHINWLVPGDGTVLISCGAGVSRSTALGLVLIARDLGPGRESEAVAHLLDIRGKANPNLAIIRHGDALLNRNGALLRAATENGALRSRASDKDRTRRDYLRRAFG